MPLTPEELPRPGSSIDSRSAKYKSGAAEVSLLGNAIAKQAIVLGFVLEQLTEFSQGGEIGRRARLRIAKSSISERRFAFYSERLLRMENRYFV